MINLDFKTPYQYSKLEKQHLKELRRKYGHFYQNGYGKNNKMVWYDGEKKTKNIKHSISEQLLIKANFCCAYCAKSLVRSEKSIDHFIPNAAYPKYSFHPLNLIPSCGYCNEILKKQHDPIATAHRRYHLMDFNMIHPIVDDVSNHLFYKLPENIALDLDRCTAKAKESIRIFKLDSYEMSIERSKQHFLTEKFPLTDLQLTRLVAETATYR